MSKQITRESHNGRFVIGRRSAEKFSAVEGIVRSARTGKLIEQSDASNESGDARRARIRAEFARAR
jgi:hypothetical protein